MFGRRITGHALDEIYSTTVVHLIPDGCEWIGSEPAPVACDSHDSDDSSATHLDRVESDKSSSNPLDHDIPHISGARCSSGKCSKGDDCTVAL